MALRAVPEPASEPEHSETGPDSPAPTTWTPTLKHCRRAPGYRPTTPAQIPAALTPPTHRTDHRDTDHRRFRDVAHGRSLPN
jgi:hypothetical protein